MTSFVSSELKRGAMRTLITSPRVVAEFRLHTGCDSAVGVEVEGSGSNATRGDYWEDRCVHCVQGWGIWGQELE